MAVRGATTAPASEAPASEAPPSEAPASESAAAESPSEAAVDYSGYKACVAFDTGGLGDKGFNDLAKKGLEDAKALGFQTAFSEAQGATDYAANIQRLIDEGCQSIVTVGFNQAQATIEAVKANPDIAFAQVDAVWDETANGPTPANFSGLDFQIDEAATLAGYLAAGFSKSGIIGTYGGQQFPGVTRFMDGIAAGINIYNEKKGTTVAAPGLGRGRSRPARSSAATTPGVTPPRASSWPRRSSTRARTSSTRSRAPRATAPSRPCSRPTSGPSASTPTRRSPWPSTPRRS